MQGTKLNNCFETCRHKHQFQSKGNGGHENNGLQTHTPSNQYKQFMHRINSLRVANTAAVQTIKSLQFQRANMAHVGCASIETRERHAEKTNNCQHHGSADTHQMLTTQKCHAAQANNNHVRLLMIMLAGAVTHFAHTSNDDVCQGCCFDRQRDPYASFSMCAPCLLNLLVSTEQKRELVARLESIHYTERRSMTMTNENVGKTMRKHTSTLRAIATHIASHSDAKRKTTELDERATTSSLCDKSKRHWSTHEPEAEHEAGALQLYKKTGPLSCTKTGAPSCTNHRGPLLTINTGVPWLYKSRGLLVVQNRGSLVVQKPGPLSCAKTRALSSTKAGAPWLETGAPSLYKNQGP